MLTVYKMPLKNHFLTGIGSGYDKISYQDELKPITTLGFTGGCLGVDYEKESSNWIPNTFNDTEIFYDASGNGDSGVMISTWDFDINRIQNTNSNIC